MEKVAKSSQGKMGQRQAIRKMRLIHWQNHQQNQIKQNHKNRRNLQNIKSFDTLQVFGILGIFDTKREDIYGGGGAIKNGKRGDTYAHRESGKPKSKGEYE